MMRVKPVEFLGDAKKQIRDWPETARKRAGVEIARLQFGVQPNDYKPMRSIGPGVEERAGRENLDRSLSGFPA